MDTKKYTDLMKQYSTRYGDFVLAYHGNPKARWHYINHNTKDYKELVQYDRYPNHRYIFPDEVIIDVDVDDLDKNLEATKYCINRLNELKLKFSLWKTYEKKHFHIFFPELKDMETNKRSNVKEQLLEWICGAKMINYGRIDTALHSKHLIRCEYGLYEKRFLEYRHKEYILGDIFNLDNKIPLKITMKVVKKQNAYKNINYDVTLYKGETPKCVEYLLSQDFSSLKDGRDRAMFFLTWWFKQQEEKEEDWVFKAEKFNKYNLNNYFNRYQMNGKINYAKRNNGKSFCHRFVHKLLEELGVKHECNMNEAISLKITGE